jgi:hypothetical protein
MTMDLLNSAAPIINIDTVLPSVIDVAYRGYCERTKPKERWWPGKTKDDEWRPSSRPKHFLAFDTETVTPQTRAMPGFDSDRWHWKSQNFMLLPARFGETEGMRTTDEFLVYPDDLPPIRRRSDHSIRRRARNPADCRDPRLGRG